MRSSWAEAWEQLFGGLPPQRKPAEASHAQLFAALKIYETALLELSCLGDLEAPAYARVARRALREAREAKT